MTSKYDTYWQDRLASILPLFEQTGTTGTSPALTLTDLEALGERDSWYGKLEIVNGVPVYDSAAHVTALGALLAPRLPESAQGGAWTVTVSKELRLTLERTEARKTTWFDSAFRAAKLAETVTRAAEFLGPLTPETPGAVIFRQENGAPVYVLFSAQKDRWFAPRKQSLETVAAASGCLVFSLTDETSSRFDLWALPAAELLDGFQRAGYAASLDRGSAYSINVDISDAADMIRQINRDIRPHHRESGRTEVTRSRFWPAGGPAPVLAKPFDEMFGSRAQAEWAFGLLTTAAVRLGLSGPDDPMASWTLGRRAGEYHLHFSFGSWLVLGLAGANRKLTLELALLRDRVDMPAPGESFSQPTGQPPVTVYYVDAETFRVREETLLRVYEETLDHARQTFATRKASPYHKYNNLPIARAVFDARARSRLLAEGVQARVEHFWKIAPGDDAWHWAECKKQGCIAIGWDELGDLSQLDRANFDARRDAAKQEHPDWTDEGLEQVWRFLQIQEGDRIVANQGTTKVLGIGTVTGPYYFVPGVRHGHRLPVRWDDTELRAVSEGGWRRTLVELPEAKFLALVSAGSANTFTDAHVQVADSTKSDRSAQPEYTLAQCAEETGFKQEELAGWVRAIERKGQAILYGPPGTGKTFIAERLARHLVGGGDGFVELVQFHPAYAYEDFIQGIRPKTADGGGLAYPTMPGRFLEFCDKAKGRGCCALIIDEINRANLARVFGELMYLLEYRDREVPLAGGGTLRVPDNIRVIGTMNTADRSIALVDHALRRRFAFLALYPSYQVLRDFHEREGTGYPVEKLIHVLTRLNDAIGDKHYHVGITFFLRKALADEIGDIWRMEIGPYLDEYFFDQPDKADAFRWSTVRADLKA